MNKVASIVVAILTMGALYASPEKQEAAGAPVHVAGQTLFVLHSGIGSFSTAERAQAVDRRLDAIRLSAPSKIQAAARKSDSVFLVLVDNHPVIEVTEADARFEEVSPEVLAQKWASAIQAGLSSGIQRRMRDTLLHRILILAGVILASLVLLVLLGKMRRRLKGWLATKRDRVPALRFKGLELVSAERIYFILSNLLLLGLIALMLLVVVTALLLIFGQFPTTKQNAYQVFLWLWEPLKDIAKGILSYLPNLFYILVIIIVTRTALRVISLIFEQAHRGTISLEPWLHADVALPTSQIIKAILIIMALFFIAPLVPGTGSTAARGISVILGLMVSFGSSSTVGNLIAGIVLTYMRPFQLGDRVKAGDATGDVIERTFLYTKIRTIKNEEVIVPSLQVLGGSIVNYSLKNADRCLILYTSVTIGYDAPWRKVHELLIRAAEKTNDIRRDPKPFVLQTSLDDFFVSYQLNAYTDEPNKMATLYSELHQNIQDSFNEGGIEIMSPHYQQLRDGNQTTIPAEYRAAGYRPTRFMVDAAGTASGE